MNSLLISMGITRDSWLWFWSKLVSGAGLLVTGFVPLDNYFTPPEIKVITVICVVILFLSGQYSTSSLPGASHVEETVNKS